MATTLLPTPRRAWLAAAFDAAAIVAFVLVGSGQHKIHEGAGWFFTVLWPLALGWLVVSLGSRLYTATARPWLRLGATIAVATALGMALRAAFTDHGVPVAFVIVYALWMVLLTFGWRGVAVLAQRRRTRPARVT